MKSTKIAIASAFLAASSFSTGEIVINDFLSFDGFVDSSYTHTDSEIKRPWQDNSRQNSDNNFQVDQVEIGWLFDFDPVTAQIELEYTDRAGITDTEVEQAFITYMLDDGGMITVGRYASMLGFEAFEPTGLYQYSTAYDLHNVLEDGRFHDSSLIPTYAQGVKFSYEGDNTFFGISLQDQVYDVAEEGKLSSSDYGVEVAASVASDNVTWFVGGAYEDSEAGDSYLFNTYVTYEAGPWIFAAEFNYGNDLVHLFKSYINSYEGGINTKLQEVAEDNAVDPMSDTAAGDTEDAATAGDPTGNFGDEKAYQFLVMANYAYSDQGSITGRLSWSTHELDGSRRVTATGADTDDNGEEFSYTASAGAEAEGFKATLAHNYAFTDNLLLVTEISYVDAELEMDGLGDGDYESLLGAVELIFTF